MQTTVEDLVLELRGETLRFVDARSHAEAVRSLEAEVRAAHADASAQLVRISASNEQLEAELDRARLAVEVAERKAKSLQREVHRLGAIAEAARVSLQDGDLAPLRTAVIDHEKGT